MVGAGVGDLHIDGVVGSGFSDDSGSGATSNVLPNDSYLDPMIPTALRGLNRLIGEIYPCAIERTGQPVGQRDLNRATRAALSRLIRIPTAFNQIG